MSVNVIYGSDGGATKGIASRIAKRAQGRSIDVKDATRADFEACSLLILGSPTYGNGDLQTDWEAHLGKLRAADLSGRRVALLHDGMLPAGAHRLSWTRGRDGELPAGVYWVRTAAGGVERAVQVVRLR